MKDEIIKKLLDVKWNLVIMAAFCFLFAVYMYVTPVEGGLGMFMITPHNGLAGLLEMLPWIGIFLGAATLDAIQPRARTSCARCAIRAVSLNPCVPTNIALRSGPFIRVTESQGLK